MPECDASLLVDVSVDSGSLLAVKSFIAWFPILFFDTIPRQSITLASYPNVRTRALGTLYGNKVWGHGVAIFFAVHIFSRSPVRPWTNIKTSGIAHSKRSRLIDYVVLCIICY